VRQLAAGVWCLVRGHLGPLGCLASAAGVQLAEARVDRGLDALGIGEPHGLEIVLGTLPEGDERRAESRHPERYGRGLGRGAAYVALGVDRLTGCDVAAACVHLALVLFLNNASTGFACEVSGTLRI